MQSLYVSKSWTIHSHCNKYMIAMRKVQYFELKLKTQVKTESTQKFLL